MMLFILLALVAFIPTNPDHYRYQTSLALGLGALMLWRHVRIKTSALLATALVITLLMGVAHFAWRVSPFQHFGPWGAVALENCVLQAVVFLLLTTLPVLLAPRKQIGALFLGFSFITLLNSCWLIFEWANGRDPRGVFDNSAMDASFIAVMYPLLTFKPGLQRYNSMDLRSVRKHWAAALWDVACVVLPVWAIFISKSSTGFFALGAVCLAKFLTRFGWRSIFFILGMAVATTVLGAWWLGPQLFNSSGRVIAWQQAWAWWWSNASVWWGTGLGTFWALGPKVILDPKGMTWLHNDWFQVLFEMGVVGFTLVIAVYTQLLSRAFKTPWLFSCLVGYGFVALTQMPLRHGLMALFGALLVRGVFDRD